MSTATTPVRPLMTIADLSTVYMAADVPESQIRLITQRRARRNHVGCIPGRNISRQGSPDRGYGRCADPDHQSQGGTEQPDRNDSARTCSARSVTRKPFGRSRLCPPARSSKAISRALCIGRSPEAFFTPVAVTFGKQDGELRSRALRPERRRPGCHRRSNAASRQLGERRNRIA